MDQKKLLQELVENSYTNGVLDEKKVAHIADKLSARLLRIYTAALKAAEKKRNIFVETAAPLTQDQKKTIQEMFPGKTIQEKLNPPLLAGVKLLVEDTIYNFNLKQTLHNAKQYLVEGII